MLIADIIISVLLVTAAFRGFSKGLVVQLTGLVALAGGILASYYFWEKAQIGNLPPCNSLTFVVYYFG